MVNHVRTWLANLSPSNGTAAGEEYIVSSFRPVPESSMSASLRQVRRVLFGITPSRDTVLVRTAVFLQLIQASPFSSDITATDARLTYSPDGSRIFDSDISDDDKSYNLSDILAGLEFLNNPTSLFFTGYTDYLSVWQQSQDQFDKLAAVVLVVASRTERAATGRE